MANRDTPSNRATFWRLMRFLGPYRKLLYVSTGLAFISQAGALAFPWLTKDVINAIGSDDKSEVPWLIGAVLVIGIVKATCTLFRRLISGQQALGVELDLRNAIYAKLIRLSFGYFDRQQTGQLMSRATVDLQSVRFFLGYGLIFFFQHVFTVLAIGVLLFIVSWKLALIVVALTPIMVALAYRYSRVSHPVLRDVQQKMADVATVAEENVVGVHVVKAFAQEQAEQEKFEARSEALFRQSVRANRQRAFYVPVLSFVPLLAQAAVLLAGGHMVVGNSMSVGDFVAFNLYLGMMIFPLRMLGMWVGEGQRATASGERIFQVIDEPEEIRDSPNAGSLPEGPGRVRFEGVDFAYEPGKPVLEGLDFELDPGRTVALIGHTGSGKTSLASLIPRFYDVSAGKVTIDGADVRDVTLETLRSQIGVIAQDPFLFSATVRENLTFGGPAATDAEIEEAARHAQAHEFIERLPQGYDTVIGERGITLSGGQRQRLAIARALLVDPRILILDDATASVDASTEARIRLGLREAMKGRTTVIIAHRLSTIALADEIIVLDHGRVVARGTHDEVLAVSDVYREIYEHGQLDSGIPEQEVA
jgi:ATP-binding cassette subfamily B protein